MASALQFPVDQAALVEALDSVQRAALVKREELACFTLRQLPPLIQMMHNNKIVHCDIKTENIMIGSNKELYLIDLGMASPFGMPVHGGTYTFLPSDVLLGLSGKVLMPAAASPAVDCFSLGMVLYHVLTGGQRRHAYLAPELYQRWHEQGQDLVLLAALMHEEERVLWPQEVFNLVSPALLDLVEGLLSRREGARTKMQEVGLRKNAYMREWPLDD